MGNRNACPEPGQAFFARYYLMGAGGSLCFHYVV